METIYLLPLRFKRKSGRLKVAQRNTKDKILKYKRITNKLMIHIRTKDILINKGYM